MEYSANFLWGFQDDSIEAIGYEFANAKTETYQKECWNDLLEKIKDTYATARTEQLQKRVDAMAELLRMADCPESLIESPNSINHQEPSEETREWAKQVIADHKALQDKRTSDEKNRDRVNKLELIILTAMENMILGNGKEAYENLAMFLPTPPKQ